MREPSVSAAEEKQILSKTSWPSSSQNTTATDSDHETTSKSKLADELESRPEQQQGNQLVPAPAPDASACEEIIKELKNVQKQNSLTHRLLTTMILITLAWQLSEVSLILKIKEGFANPFKSLAGFIKSFLPNRRQVAAAMEPPSLLKIPELSYLGWPGFDTSDSDDDDDRDSTF